MNLSECAQGSMGFGGISMHIIIINSDRICGIRFKQGSSEKIMSVIGVYIPVMPGFGHRVLQREFGRVGAGGI